MENRSVIHYAFPNGGLQIFLEDDAIVKIRFKDNGVKSHCNDKIIRKGHPVVDQLDQYFKGQSKSFDVKLKMEGTPFQKKVWMKLQKIPYGQTKTYGEIARALGNSKSARAVGMACNRNPIPIIIPCHRVVGQNGSLTGYAGGLEIKKYLLNLEKGVA